MCHGYRLKLSHKMLLHKPKSRSSLLPIICLGQLLKRNQRSFLEHWTVSKYHKLSTSQKILRKWCCRISHNFETRNYFSFNIYRLTKNIRQRQNNVFSIRPRYRHVIRASHGLRLHYGVPRHTTSDSDSRLWSSIVFQVICPGRPHPIDPWLPRPDPGARGDRRHRSNWARG